MRLGDTAVLLDVDEMSGKVVDIDEVMPFAASEGNGAWQNHTFDAAKGIVSGGNMCPFGLRKGTYCGTGAGSVKNVQCEKAFRQKGVGRYAAGGRAAI